MPYLCELEVSKQKRAIFLFFPSFEDKLRLKTLNLRFLTKKQVNFRAVYLLIHKLLIVKWHNMLHRKFSAFSFGNLAHRNSYSYLHRLSNTPVNISISLLEIPNRVANSLHPFTTSITSEIIFSAVF